MAQARALLEDPGQGELDLGVEPTPLVTPVLGPPSRPALLAPASVVPVRASVARVLSTDTRTLFGALAHVYAGLGLDVLGDEVFRDLVLARVVELLNDSDLSVANDRFVSENDSFVSGNDRFVSGE